MKIEIQGFKVPMRKTHKPLKKLLEEKYKIFERFINEIIIVKQSVDARDKKDIYLVYNLIADIEDSKYELVKNNKFIKPYQELSSDLEYPQYKYSDRPIIVGFGPSGIFSALYLARCNARPIIIERGNEVDQRIKDVNDFLDNKKLNIQSNIQFGEGGAGTFSDGKLTTNLKDPLIRWILNEFVAHGAPQEIRYQSMPHIGTDYLTKVVKNIRQEIISLGGEFYFGNTFNKLGNDNNNLIIYTNKGNKFTTNHLILGLGHSARDTIEYLYSLGLNMEAKSFSMGVRIEHTKESINKAQYGEFSDNLPAAYYKLNVHLNNGRGVYTFCMCPGGKVMASQSEENTILTNGMSLYARDYENSNSGLLVDVTPQDYMKDSVLDGLRYQEKYERLAFNISKDYKAPANLVKEFLNGQVAKEIRSVKPSYPHGIVFANLNECLPDYVVESLREAIPLLDKKVHGFNNPDAILTGIETRSSCPVRILRDSQTKMSSYNGIYPIGEGAGYAGGITSAALDGLKTAIEIVK